MMKVQLADTEIARAVQDVCVRHDLTSGELVSILSGQVRELAKYIIREERHPGQPGKKGDEE